MNELVVLAASAAVVVFMVAVAWMLGFRARVRLNEETLAQLAANEGDRVEASLIASNGRAALARLSGGKWLTARAMGLDVGARVAPAGALTLKLRKGKLTVAFADLGYPPLHLRLETAPPAWLEQAARGAKP